MVQSSNITDKNEMPKPTNQRKGVRRDKTMELILSVIVVNVWPGFITGGHLRS
jgi:hypothetical protein